MVNMDELTAVVGPTEATWMVAPETAEEAAPASPMPAPRRSVRTLLRRRWVRVSLAGVLTGALVAVLVSGSVNDVQTHRALSTTQRQLGATQKQLTSTRGELASTKSDLATAESALAASRAQVDGLQNTVAAQRAQLDANGREISNLNDCLNGFLQFMDEASNGDSAAADRTLNSINSVCQAAYDGLPKV